MGRPLGLLVAMAWLCAVPAGGRAQEFAGERVRIHADELSFEEERGLYEAVGNVRVEQPGGRVLTADWLTVNETTQMGVAVGNVEIRDGDELVRADFAAINIRTLEALATKATLDTPLGMDFRGDAVERTGANTYRVQKGTFTTCRCPPGEGRRPWELEVEDADIRVGGYAVARDVTFRVLGVPLLYTPWLILPVKTERQSGFLVPAASNTSRGGTEIELPFFWAPRHDLNVLLHPTYIQERGFKNSIEAEYVFGEHGTTEAGVGFLFHDDDVDGDGAQSFSSDRWAYWLHHRQSLGPGLRFGADINRISDNNYPLDFEDLRAEARNTRFLSSTAWATYGRGGLYAGLEASHLDDLQSPNDLDRDDFLLHRLPDLRLTTLPRRLGTLPLLGALDLRYTYFWQQADTQTLRGNSAIGGLFFDTGTDGVFDPDEPRRDGSFVGVDNHADGTVGLPPALGDTEGDGLFQEGELLADFGHRLDLQPRVSFPWRWGALETLSELGYRGTFYAPEHGDSETRSLWTGRFDARAHFVKEIVLGGRSLQHIVEPKLAFGFISDESQDRNPVFIPPSAVIQKRLVDGDLRVLLRNPADRVLEERLLQLGVENRFYAPARAAGGGPRLIGSLRLGAGYDFEESDTYNAFLHANFFPNDNLQMRTNVGYDVEDTRLAEADVSMLWRSEPRYGLRSSRSDRRNELQLTYRYLRDLPEFFEDFQRPDDIFDEFDSGLDRINQFSLNANWALARQIDLFASGYLSLEEASTSEGRLGVTFLSGCACWELMASVQRRTRPDDTRFTIELRLAGLGRSPGASRP